MQAFLALTEALSDAQRLRTLAALRGGELCVCQITELLGLAPSTVSKHVAILAQAGLVESRKEGRWVYYRLAGRNSPAAVKEALRWVDRGLAGDAHIDSDRRRLRKILETDPELLCRRMRSEHAT